MGRRAQGWRLRERDGIYYVRFTHEGRPYEFSTKTGDPQQAARSAAHQYSLVVSGRWRPLGVTATAPLDEMIAAWLEDLEATHDEKTVATYLGYAKAHYLPFFRELAGMQSAKIADYSRMRLRAVTRSTVRKERSALRSFLKWCAEKRFVLAVPEFPSLPDRAQGVRSGPQREHVVELSPEQVEAFLTALPERARRGGWPVRARFVVAYETGLRPATLDAITAPESYRRGGETLRIRDAEDKARFGREVPLSPRARRTLDAVVPDVGPIFGRHDFRCYVKAAAKVIGLPSHLAEDLAAYDLRHARATHLLERGANIPGVQFLFGHRRPTTTDRYVKASRRAAEAAIQAATGTWGAPPDTPPERGPSDKPTESAAQQSSENPSMETSTSAFRFQWDNSRRGSTPLLRTNEVAGSPDIPPAIRRGAGYLAVLRATWDELDEWAAAAEAEGGAS